MAGAARARVHAHVGVLQHRVVDHLSLPAVKSVMRRPVHNYLSQVKKLCFSGGQSCARGSHTSNAFAASFQPKGSELLVYAFPPVWRCLLYAARARIYLAWRRPLSFFDASHLPVSLNHHMATHAPRRVAEAGGLHELDLATEFHI